MNIAEPTSLQNHMTSVVSPGLLALLEAYTCRDFYRLGINHSCS